MREACVTIDGRRAHFHETGAGPAVVVVHGLGLSGRVFRRHCRALGAAGFRAIAPDLPGFGASAGPRTGQSVPETAEWLLAFHGALGLDRPAWLGHSLAAQAVLELAGRAPDRARALILATPTGAPGRSRLLWQLYGFARDIGAEPLSLIPAVARLYLSRSAPALLGTWLKAARDDPVANARRVRCPTLVIISGHDPVVSADFLSILVQRLGDARLERLQGRGHGIVFNRTGAFDRAVIAFLREVTDGAARRR